jgi:hypothetical protein
VHLNQTLESKPTPPCCQFPAAPPTTPAAQRPATPVSSPVLRLVALHCMARRTHRHRHRCLHCTTQWCTLLSLRRTHRAASRSEWSSPASPRRCVGTTTSPPSPHPLGSRCPPGNEPEPRAPWRLAASHMHAEHARRHGPHAHVHASIAYLNCLNVAWRFMRLYFSPLIHTFSYCFTPHHCFHKSRCILNGANK